MKYSYVPTGVCSKKYDFDINGDTVEHVTITGGCPGNLLGISHLLEGKPIDEIIASLQGVRCGGKNTSCPDQIAKALISYKQSHLE